jgi:hypothetical protein
LPFELNIAVKRGPIEQREGAGQGASRFVTAVEISGDLSLTGAIDLTQRLDDVVTGAPSSVILRFVGDVHVSPDDLRPIDAVAAWLKRRRRDGYSVYVEVADAHVRDVFMRVEDIKGAMLPLGANPDVPRRTVDDPSSPTDGSSP